MEVFHPASSVRPRLPGKIVCCSSFRPSRPPSRLGHSVVSVMESKIGEKLSASKVVVKDAYGDGRYLSLNVVSSAFEGKSKVERRKMILGVVWEEVKYGDHIVEQMMLETSEEVGTCTKK